MADKDVPFETQEELLNRIIQEETLNRKQTIAFRIIANSFFKLMDDRKHGINSPIDSKYRKYLSLLLTGPGGTGKTHVVKAIQRVMEAYGRANNIRFLAPSGAAAALIDGMTIHKGFSIKVRKRGKGKGNRVPGESEDYSIIMSLSDKRKIREEFKDVDIVMIDEVSLLSQEILAEIDHALRYAKGNNLFFGGIIIIFAGDFYQYPPVGGTPLYTPVRYAKKNEDITDQLFAKRLGRMVWKSVDEVVFLEEQQRMRSDPEYGNAVLRLRKRKCVMEDVDLFNSRVIKSVNCPDGIDMGTDGNEDSVIIVSKNLTRQAINMKKAAAICANTDKLTLCAAFDTVKGANILSSSRQDLLKMDISRFSREGALPGYIPMYEGMPIILRNKNISTELGIVNGAQGFVRKFSTAVCPTGYTYATSAIIEIPKSRVQLSNLPPKYFPLEPLTWNFTSSIHVDPENPEKLTKCRVHRSQLSCQPGFASTGHSAQGKTLPKILCALNEGGFAAYVAASRATSREGLAIFQPVTLENLNHRLPSDLIQEEKRHEIMEHNTLVKFGFLQANILPVPDPEGESAENFPQGKPLYSIDEDDENPTPKKAAKKKVFDSPSPVKNETTQYTPIMSSVQMNSCPPATSPLQPCVGVIWSNNSCGYDAVFMVLYSIWRSDPLRWCESFSNSQSKWLRYFQNSFSPQTASLPTLEDIRDVWRYQLHAETPQYYTWGAFVSLHQLLYDVLLTELTVRIPRFLCSLHPYSNMHFNPTPIQSFLMSSGTDQFASTTEWIQSEGQTVRHQCEECGLHLKQKAEWTVVPEMLSFEIALSAQMTIDPQISIPVNGNSHLYQIRGVIYFGGQHFVARLIEQDTAVWYHDGIVTGKNMIYEGQLESVDLKYCRDGKKPSALFYTHLLYQT
jgi:PIF1-like helicase